VIFGKYGRKGLLFTQQMHAIMWVFFIFFLIIASFIVIFSVNLHVSRDVENDNIETFLAKEYLLNNLVEEGEFKSNDVLSKDTLYSGSEYAVGVEFDGNSFPLNKQLYDEKPFCKFEQYDCGEYSGVFLVDGELKEVDFEVVWKNA